MCMKNNILLLSLAILTLAACNGANKQEKSTEGNTIESTTTVGDSTEGNKQVSDSTDLANAPIMEFKNDTYDFSKIVYIFINRLMVRVDCL